MKTVVLEKVLNNTELGRGNTHETYILVNKTIDLEDFMPTDNSVNFKCRKTGKKYTFRFKVTSNNKENRINGLGQYYRDNQLLPGDKLFLEKTTFDGKTYYSVYSEHYTDTIALQKTSYGYEILTKEHVGMLLNRTFKLKDGRFLEVVFKQKTKKRTDSPEETNFYDIKIDGELLYENYLKNNEFLIVKVSGDSAILYKPITCVKHVYEKGVQ